MIKPCLSHWVRLSPSVTSMWPWCKCFPPVGLTVHQRPKGGKIVTITIILQARLKSDNHISRHCQKNLCCKSQIKHEILKNEIKLFTEHNTQVFLLDVCNAFTNQLWHCFNYLIGHGPLILQKRKSLILAHLSTERPGPTPSSGLALDKR